MGHITLVTGGARSGKSAMAERLAAGYESVAYIATARVLDDEMEQRVALHRAGRPPFWITREEPLDPAGVIREGGCQLYILDCVTLWLTNIVLDALGALVNVEPDGRRVAEERSKSAVDGLLLAARESNGDLVAVTNELGCGIVPDNALARFFRDVQGRANQRLAATSDRVILMVCGLPIEVRQDGGGLDAFLAKGI